MNIYFLKRRLCRLFLSFSLPVAISLIGMACTGASRQASTRKAFPDQSVPYPVITVNSSVVLSPEQGEKSPRMELSLTLLDSTEDELLQKLLYKGLTPEEYADNLVLNYKDLYREILAITEDVSEPPPSVFDWTYQEVHGARVYPRMQVIDRVREYYTGGAHGMVEKEYFLIDLEQKAQLHLKDLFREGTEGALQAKAEDALRAYSGLEEGAPLSGGYYFDDSVEPSGNFFLTPQGVSFHWDPYEIAPYVVGPVEISIPYGDVEDLFNSRGTTLRSQFD